MKVVLRIRQHVIYFLIIRVPGVSVNDQFGKLDFYSKPFRRFGKQGNYEIII